MKLYSYDGGAFVMENIKEVFEKETGLRLRDRYDSNGYYECSGVSYQNICSKIINFNANHNTNIYATDDTIKDVTTIYLR